MVPPAVPHNRFLKPIKAHYFYMIKYIKNYMLGAAYVYKNSFFIINAA